MVKQLQTKLMLLLCLLVAGVCSAWAETITFDASKDVTSDVSNYSENIASFTTDGGTWKAVGYGTVANTSITIGKGNANYLQTPVVPGVITSVKVTCSSSSSYYLKVIDNDGNELAAQQKCQTTSSDLTFSITGDHNQVKLFAKRQSSTSNAAVTITKVVVTYTSVTSYSISAQTNNQEWGTVSLNSRVITASPENGYRVSKSNPFTVTPEGSATVAQSGNTFTVTPSADCTVTINFEEIPNHTISWNVNGVVSATSVPEDAAISFEEPTTNIPSGYSFMGWYGSEYSSADNAPEYITSATCTDDMTYYAVFAKASEKDAWKKVAASDVEGEGVYALLTTDYHAFNGTMSSGHGQATSTAFSFTNNIATTAPAGTCELTLTASGNGFTMYNSEKGYLYATKASSGGLAWHDSESSYWYYNSNNDGNWQYKSNEARLRSYSNSSFRTYGTNNGAVLVFAKKIKVTSYSDFCTSVAETATITSAGWATWVATNNVEVPSTVSAYIVSNIGSTSVSLTELLAIPAGTPVVLNGDEGTVTFSQCDAADCDDVSANALRVVGTGDAITTAYVLANKNNKTAFYLYNGNGLKVGRVYLPVTGAARELLSFDDDTTTGVQSIYNGKLAMDNVYDLQGRHIVKPAKGLYIMNGKKVIIK